MIKLFVVTFAGFAILALFDAKPLGSATLLRFPGPY